MNQNLHRIGKFLFLALLFASLLSCKQAPKAVKKIATTSTLNIFALDNIRSSGFESVVIKEFARKNRTALHLNVFPDLPSLLKALRSDTYKGKVDLVLGLDNTWAVGDSLNNLFTPAPGIDRRSISHEIPHEDSSPYLPYAYGNLAFIYNTKTISNPPRSFGELQDSRFYTQVAVCDPHTSGLGRSTLFWSVVMFGNSGYDQLWSSLRKNVRKVYASQRDAVDALRKGECSLMLGLHSTPAWIKELNPSETNFQIVNPQEGSFLYIESAALCKDAPNQAIAAKFLQYLVGTEAQMHVMYKLGLMPVNGRTPLPLNFTSLPLSIYSLNERLDQPTVQQNLPLWLKRWDELFVLRLGI